jgi:glycosyltransferase involved in cell wall biosynthesis/SAM-dependent methyltransferase
MIKPRETHWHEVAENYTLEPESFSVGLAAEIANIFQENAIAPPASLLEAGCGSGHLSLELARQGYQADLLDFEPLAIDKAQASYRKAFGKKADKYQYIVGDLNNLAPSLGTQKFDIVWNSGVLEHFSAELLAQVLSQMGAHARQAVFFIVPNPQSLVYLAYRQKMLQEGRWSFGVEFLREDYLQVAKGSGLTLLKSGFCGPGYTRNYLEYIVQQPEASKHFTTLFDGNMLPSELVLAWYLLAPQATARKTAGPGKQTVPTDTAQMLDRTFYLDAIGAANATITNLKQQLETMRMESEQAKQQLEARETVLRELQQKIQDHQSATNALENKLSSAHQRLQHQESSLVERHSLSLSLEARIHDKDQVIQTLTDRLNQEMAAVGSTQEALQERDARLQALQTRLGELETAQMQWATDAHALADANTELENLQTKLVTTENALQQRSQELAAIKQQIEEAVSTRLRGEAVLNERQELITELRIRLEGQQRELQAMREQLDAETSANQHLSASCEQLQASLISGETYRQELSKQLEAQHEAARKLEAVLGERQDVVQSLGARLLEKDQLIGLIESRLAQQEQLAVSAHAERANQEERLHSISAELDALRITHAQLERLDQEHQRQLMQHETGMRQLNEQLSAETAENARLRQMQSTTQTECERLTGTLHERESRLLTLSAEVQRQAIELTQAQTALNYLQQQLTTAETEAHGLREELTERDDALRRQMEAAEIAAEALREKLVERATLQKQLAESGAESTELRNSLAERNAKLKLLQTNTSELNLWMGRIHQARLDLHAGLQIVEKNTQGLFKTLRQKHATDLSTQAEQVRKQKTNLNELQQSIAEFGQKLQGQIAELEAGRDQLDAALAESELETKQAREELTQTKADFAAQCAAWRELLTATLASVEELKDNLFLKRLDANAAITTLRQYQGLSRFRWAHRLHLISHNLRRGSFGERCATLGTLVGIRSRKAQQLLAEPDALDVPLHTIGKISEYMIMANELCENLKSMLATSYQTVSGAMRANNGSLAAHRNAPALPPANLEAEPDQPRRKILPRLPRAPHGRRRVAYLTNQLLDWNDQRPRYGGGERYAIELARLLRELGLEVTFFQPAIREWEGRYEEFPVKCFIPGASFSEFAFGTCELFTRMTLEYDHVIHNLPEYSSGLMRQDALMICHGIWFDHNNYSFAKFRTPQWYAHLYNAFSTPRTIVSVDTNSINYIRAVWPELAPGMRYIPNFYRIGDFKPDPTQRNPDRLMVLFPRRSQINRGSRILESILNRVPHDVDFCWVGEGDPEDTEMIRNLCLRDRRLTFHCADFDAMPRWYQKADITVIPTLACEGTSLSCLEAFASGSATISTNVGGLSDLVQNGNNGLLVDPFPETLAEAINYLIEHPLERKRLEQVGPESARAFELQNWRRKWARILIEQKWTTEDALARIGLDHPQEHMAPRWKRSGEAGAPRIGIVTRNAVHGGVESIIAMEQQGLNAEVLVSGGLDSPETCPFTYTRCDTYGDLAQKLTEFDVVVYHWIPDLALQAIQVSGLPCVEFVHRTDTCESDKRVPTRIVAHSDFLAEYVRETFNRPCEVIPHPIDLEKFRPTKKQGTCIGAITSLYPTKGIDIFLRAWAQIARRFPQLQVRFYGSGPEKQNLESLAAELGIKAEFRAPVRDPWRVLEEFTCFVLPSRLEGLPMTVLETMAMDIPIVASDIPGVVEFNTTVERLGFGQPLTTFRSEVPEDMARVLTEVLKRKRRPHTSAFIQAWHSPERHLEKLRLELAQAISQNPRIGHNLKLVQTWVDERILATPENPEGAFLLAVNEMGDIRQIFAANALEYHAQAISHDYFPITLIRLPAATTQLEWQTTADREVAIGWQIDWLTDDLSSAGVQAGGMTLLPGKTMGAMGRDMPESVVYARISIRPQPGETCFVGPILLRAHAMADTATCQEIVSTKSAGTC